MNPEEPPTLPEELPTQPVGPTTVSDTLEVSAEPAPKRRREDWPEDPPAVIPRRIPHLGHALLFVSFTGVVLMVTQLLLLLKGLGPSVTQTGTITVAHPKLQLASLAATYLLTLTASWFFFPVVWHRPFLEGLSWNWRSARGQASKLVALGLLLGLLAQVVSYFATAPKTLPIDDFFSTPLDAWLITLFGTLLAPIFEETCFRGFLVPAFAIAYDWLSLPRTPSARTQWQTTTVLTPASLLFAAIATSIAFALLHAQQISHALPALGVLFAVSLILTFVRVRTQSVAASALVHATYNTFVFLTVLFATGGYRHLDRLTK